MRTFSGITAPLHGTLAPVTVLRSVIAPTPGFAHTLNGALRSAPFAYFVLSIAALSCWVLPAHALDVEDVPDPRKDHHGWVSDAAGVLGDAAPEIEARLSALQRDTGAQVAVAIVPSIGEQNPREFATALLQHWGVGRKGRDDGVLVLQVLDQRRLEIETGYGSEGLLPDATCSWLVQEVATPYLHQNALAQGHRALSRGLDHALRNPGASHEALLAAALTGMEAVPAAPLADTKGQTPPSTEAPSWLAPLERRQHDWLLGGVLAALAALALRIHAHRAFHREKGARFTAPWMGSLVGGLFSGFFVAFGHIGDDPETSLWGTLMLCFTALVVFARGLWFEVQAHQRYAPRQCAACGSPMRLLGERADDAHLEDGHQTEERIESRDYDVWLCACGVTSKVQYKGANPADQCKHCTYFTDRKTGSRVIRSATTSSTGLREDYYCCAQCGATRTAQVTLAKLSKSSSSSSSSGGGSSSSSFGGGRSGGGGAGGSY